MCLGCGEYIDLLPSICYGCGKATPNYVPCVKCATQYSPAHVWVTAKYDGLSKEVLRAFKYEDKRGASIALAGLIDDTLPYFSESPLVTFVPSTSSRRRQRGFEHTELMAKELARTHCWNYARVLHRTGQARQVGANRALRKVQLKDAFVVTKKELVWGRSILLIDDVVTTGATIEACTRLLKKAGAMEVNVAVFARTPEK